MKYKIILNFIINSTTGETAAKTVIFQAPEHFLVLLCFGNFIPDSDLHPRNQQDWDKTPISVLQQ